MVDGRLFHNLIIVQHTPACYLCIYAFVMWRPCLCLVFMLCLNMFETFHVVHNEWQ
jgi:hypothetical protein